MVQFVFQLRWIFSCCEVYKLYINLIRYYAWAKGFKKTFIELYLEKNWGPPYYRMKKSFKAPAGEES